MWLAINTKPTPKSHMQRVEFLKKNPLQNITN